ncbi:MAG: condensation domain-containing protein, partial [Candidatus Binatia bacterium]
MGSENLTERFANLSPAKRALLELRLMEQGAEGLVNPSIPRRPAGDTAPLSFAQQRLWFLNQLEPESPAYNESSTFRLNGILDLGAFTKALNQIVLRHEVLRTVIVTVDGSPCQVVVNNRDLDLPVIDLRAVPATDRDSEAQRLIAETIRKTFDLSRDFPLRVMLLRLGEQEHMLLVVKHHIASDGWSSGVWWRELTVLYRAFASGGASPLPELPIQYADYAVWQRDWLQGELLERQLSYWKKQLHGIGAQQLPTDRPRPLVRSDQGKHQTIELSEELSRKLKALSRQHGATLFMTLLAAFQTLLYRYTGQEDIAVGCPIAGRTRQELEGLIGFFVNTLVMRVDFSSNPTFRELLARVRG